jgi:cytidylate kinase
MSVITFFGREYTGTVHLAEKAAEIWGYRVVRDRDVIESAAREFNLKNKDIAASIYKDPPTPGRFTSGKARCIAAVKSILAREVEKGQVIFCGLLGQLIPEDIGLHILVTATDSSRLRRLRNREGNGSQKAKDRISLSDEVFLRWSLYLKTVEDRDIAEYDGVINVSRTGQSELIRLICEAADKKREERDPMEFRLAARVSRLMAEKGHPVAVSARGDRVDLRVNKPVMMLARYGKKLTALARSVDGVGMVKAEAGPQFYRADICSGQEFTPPLDMAWQPIAQEYEQLYAQVADNHAVLYHQVQDAPPLAAAPPSR